MAQAAETFDQLLSRLAHEHSDVAPARLVAMLRQEHLAAFGSAAGDIIPPVVIDAIADRLAHEERCEGTMEG